MVEEVKGNLLRAEAEALVNTVNCVGFMGKGIALQFKKAFPENYDAYQRACKDEKVQPGRMFIHETGMMLNPRYIINFPTKRHWRGASRMRDIDEGLTSLVEEVRHLGIQSIAVPPLGCGNGGLDWNVVRPKIIAAFDRLPDVKVLLYGPHGAPDPKTMPVRTGRPKMTQARALFVKLMEQYSRLSYRLTLLEIQKLAYFLQESGEPLRLRYEAGHYGPYAANLVKVLEVTEGHFTRGYGDSQKPDVEIDLLPGAADEADKFLEGQLSSKDRLERVAEIIEGFETPYGLELLSSVHWVARHSRPVANSLESATTTIRSWNDRKKRLFRPEHIRLAWKHLSELGAFRDVGHARRDRSSDAGGT